MADGDVTCFAGTVFGLKPKYLKKYISVLNFFGKPP